MCWANKSQYKLDKIIKTNVNNRQEVNDSVTMEMGKNNLLKVLK